jgi:hypothetical protein
MRNLPPSFGVQKLSVVFLLTLPGTFPTPSLTLLFIGHIVHLTPTPLITSHYNTGVFSRSLALKLTFKDVNNKEFRNVFLSETKPLTMGEPKNR